MDDIRHPASVTRRTNRPADCGHRWCMPPDRWCADCAPWWELHGPWTGVYCSVCEMPMPMVTAGPTECDECRRFFPMPRCATIAPSAKET